MSAETETAIAIVEGVPLAEFPGSNPLERHQFKPGQSGNLSGRPRGERAYLRRRWGKDGRLLFAELEALLADGKTPKKVKADILKFLVERMFGKAPLPVGVEGGRTLLSLLAEVAARTATRQEAP